jgi:hypothetical protein
MEASGESSNISKYRLTSMCAYTCVERPTIHGSRLKFPQTLNL